jgi:hypothetical protein
MDVKRLRQLIAELKSIQQEYDVWHPDDHKDRQLNPELNKHTAGGAKPPQKPCPPGHVRNAKTGQCVSLRGAKR